MPDQIRIILFRYLLPLTVIVLVIFSSAAMADDFQSEPKHHVDQQSARNETGIEIGILIILGADVRFFYRQSDSPWVVGFRYLDIKDDFVNEYAADLPNDESDKMYTKRAGIYADYIFNSRTGSGSFYASSAMFQTTKKLECYSETDSDSATSLYFGGGYQGTFKGQFGYKAGILFSPFVNLEQDTGECSNDEGGDFDLDVGLTFTF